MKELKFRAWDKRSRKYTECKDYLIYFNSGELVPIHDFLIIEQYTGRKDKNGKIEAYENDQFITNINMSPDGISSAHNISFWITVQCTIVFVEGCFLGKYELNNHSEGNYNFTNRSGFVKIPKKFEIIGNIHEVIK